MCEAVDFKDLHQVWFSTMNGRSTEKRFEKSDLSIVEASLRVGGPFWPKTKPARYVITATKRCSYLDLKGYCCSSVKLGFIPTSNAASVLITRSAPYQYSPAGMVFGQNGPPTLREASTILKSLLLCRSTVRSRNRTWV